MAAKRILIVEDESIVREDLRDMLEDLGYAIVGVAVTGRDAVAKARELRSDLVLMDIQLKGEMDGIEAAQQIRKELALPVVFLTAFADETTIARAAAACPFGYLIKPFKDRSLRATVEVALRRHQEEKRPAVSASEERSAAHADGDPFHDIIGKSAPVRSMIEQIIQVARVDSTVLIGGETGTGKERIARAIHAASERRSKPFISINCAGLTETLAASELFGHRRGAFTGAMSDHKGAFEAAEGGTIFLDEIGDIPRSQQPFLLRVLEEREIMRVGETSPRKIDVRFLASSNRRLEDEVAAGNLRADLFYRIRVARIVAPPLRDRSGDVPLLVRAFLAKLCAKSRGTARTVTEETLRALSGYAWPGNVRELKNAIEFAAIRCAGDEIQPEDLPPEIVAARDPACRTSARQDPAEEKASIIEVLSKCDGNRSEAARVLGISRATFYRRLAELGISLTDA